MSKASKDLDDLLLHYGVKGMKWRQHTSNSSDSQLQTQDQATGGGAGEDPTNNNPDQALEDVKSKIGKGPLDMLKYIIFGKPKKSNKPNTLDKVGNQLKDLKSKVGKNPLDMLKYIFFGKRTVQHSALTEEVTLGDVRPYAEVGKKVFESLTNDGGLQHSGVLGMKWGVRRDRNRPGGADGKPDVHSRSTLGKKLNSLKRERQWKSVLKNMDALSTSDLGVVARRVSLENSLKTLSRSKVGTKKDKEDYLRREHMDDAELARKVTRLKAKESLHNAVHAASKEQREFGQKVAQIGGSLGVKYVLNKRLSTKDIFEVVKNPKSSADKAKKDLLNVAMEKIKTKGTKTP